MKKVFLTVIVIITLLIAAFSASFVYYTYRDSKEAKTKVIVETNDKGDTFTAYYGNIELKVDNLDAEEESGLIKSSGTDQVKVHLLSKEGTATCTYDLEISNKGDEYVTTPDYTGKELTVKGSAVDSSDMAKSILFEEIGINDALKNKTLGTFEISNVAGGSETIQTWNIDALLYKIEGDQSGLLEKNYSYNITITNIKCNN